ncbi:MAG: hypothetical protein CL609_02860 [Anaerolineaceae bacterium]|nr:hypothetical protein [Anaerolineaceae bacterium]
MFYRISNKLIQLSKGWVVLISALIFIVFMIFVLPAQAAKSDAETNNASSPDTSFFYTTDDLYQMAEAYGEMGRAAYIRARFTFDIIWPLVYTLFLTAFTGWAAAKVFIPGSPWRMLNLIPIFGMLLDYLENISAATVMARFPLRTPVVDFLTPVFTLLKWVFVYASFVVPIGLIIIFLIKTIKKR